MSVPPGTGRGIDWTHAPKDAKHRWAGDTWAREGPMGPWQHGSPSALDRSAQTWTRLQDQTPGSTGASWRRRLLTLALAALFLVSFALGVAYTVSCGWFSGCPEVGDVEPVATGARDEARTQTRTNGGDPTSQEQDVLVLGHIDVGLPFTI